MRIRTPDGGEVPFYAVARAERGRGYASIKRADRQRVINVTGDVDPTKANVQRGAAQPAGRLPAAAPGQPSGPFLQPGRGAARAAARPSPRLLRNYVFALFLIYALLAIPLRSYLQPLIIMAVIPFGVVGAIVGHLIMGMHLSMMSVFGLVALSGVVVNSSLVLVHYVNGVVQRARRRPRPCGKRALRASGRSC